MEKPFNSNLRTKIILSFSMLVMVLIFIFLFLLNYSITGDLRKRTMENMEQLSLKVLQQAEVYIGTLDQIAKDLMMVPDVSRILLAFRDNSVLPFSERDILDKHVTRAMVLTDASASNVFIYSPDFTTIYSYQNGDGNLAVCVKNPLKLQQLQEQPPFYTSGRADARGEDGKSTFSVMRPVKDLSANRYGYVEVQGLCTDLESICDVGTVGDIILTDKYGQILYPFSALPQDVAQYVHSASPSARKGTDWNDEGDSYVCLPSEKTGLTVYLRFSSQAQLPALEVIPALSYVVIVITALIALLTIFFISNRLTKPLRRIKENMLRVNLAHMEISPSGHAYNDEIQLIDNAFERMLERLKRSMERELALVKEESEARFTALQAQIAPHFIHNTLYIISIFAEEGRPQEVVRICKQLSQMLQYVVKPSGQPVNLKNEAIYTTDYLSLQADNYHGSLFWSMHLDPAIEAVTLPRLTLQPFIENSIQHGFKNKLPPWNIAIEGACLADGWQLRIRDNGSGIEAQKLSALQQELTSLTQCGALPHCHDQEHLGNMGIRNTYLRLILLYGASVSMSIESTPQAGTTVTIACHCAQPEKEAEDDTV